VDRPWLRAAGVETVTLGRRLTTSKTMTGLVFRPAKLLIPPLPLRAAGTVVAAITESEDPAETGDTGLFA
jgi:hypothetical protein